MNSQLSVVLLIRLFDPLMIISRLSPALLIYHLDKCFRSIEICLLTIKVHINVENRNKKINLSNKTYTYIQSNNQVDL